MTRHQQVDELLEYILEAQCTPEEACAQTPELLPEVLERWTRLRLVDEQLEQLFPSTAPKAIRGTADYGDADDCRLPRIDGYDLKQVLGRGGMGVVYRARQLALDRDVALKMLLSGGYAVPQELRRFQREAQAVAALRHPNIVQIYDVAETEGQPYYTMEYVDGGSLAERLSGIPKPARDAAETVVTLAKAVQFAHDHGIIHRDLKPANVLLTLDGTPKITDFGLARRTELDAELTLSGARIGTPSYMAPEQAAGKSSTVGPAADIYSLGAILYEILTGRPPFRAETAMETQRQVIADEPVSPSRLNTRVPRDLTTICLKCLQKDPQRRYATSIALAEDLRRFLRGEPILARPGGLLQKVSKWVIRNRMLSGTILASGLLVAVILGSGWKYMLDRAVALQAAQIHISELDDAVNRQAWIPARAKLDLAEARLGGVSSIELTAKIAGYRRQLDLVERLESIRLHRADTIPGVDNFIVAAGAYEVAFREANIFEAGIDPKTIADRIKGTAIAPAIVAAIDDWTICVPKSEEKQYLMDVAQLADTNPSNSALRNHLLRSDPQALQEVVSKIVIKDQSMSLMINLSERIRQIGGNSVPFLKRMQEIHPEDFWANYVLGLAVHGQNAGESVRYYQAAIACRPHVAPVHDNLGTALGQQGRNAEALDEFRIAARLDPLYPNTRYNIARALSHLGQTNDAIGELRRALESMPKSVHCHSFLGRLLLESNQHDEAIAEGRKAIELDRREWPAYRNIRASMLKQGHPEEAVAAWKETLTLEPPAHEDWDGYAELCLFVGQTDEYRKARQQLLRRFGDTTDALFAERTGRSCLFLPLSDEELQRATKLIDLALKSESPQVRGYFRFFRFAKALAEYRSSHFEDAAKLLDAETMRVLGPAPRLLLAMCQFRLGQSELARENYTAAAASYDWDIAKATTADSWRYHLLRREAESLIGASPSAP